MRDLLGGPVRILQAPRLGAVDQAVENGSGVKEIGQ
jgi:hypothetical protein